MKTIYKYFALILIALPGVIVAGNKADSTDTVKALKPLHKNVIKFNPTPMLFWGETKNLTFSYERLVNRSQSFDITVGFLSYPQIIKDTVLSLIAFSDRQKYGINFGFSYRFYPIKRNRRPTPDGLYIGPYFSYYGNHFENHFDILYTSADQQGKFIGNINIANLGFQMGYQFIFWKRLSVDLLLFGPSISYYSANLRVEGNLEDEEVSDIAKKFAEKLQDRFPMLSTLFTDGELSQSGFQSKLGMGFRYCIQIGFHF